MSHKEQAWHDYVMSVKVSGIDLEKDSDAEKDFKNGYDVRDKKVCVWSPHVLGWLPECRPNFPEVFLPRTGYCFCGGRIEEKEE